MRSVPDRAHTRAQQHGSIGLFLSRAGWILLVAIAVTLGGVTIVVGFHVARFLYWVLR